MLSGSEVRDAALGFSIVVLGLLFFVFALIAVVFFTITHNCFWKPGPDDYGGRNFAARVFANGKLRPVEEKCIKVTIEPDDDDSEIVPDDL